jgi:hypothetical protein
MRIVRMKIAVVFVMALALSLLAAPGHAQDELPGQQLTITAYLGPNGYSCGRASYPIYCYGFPAVATDVTTGTTVGVGAGWLDVYTNAYPSPTGFIAWVQAVADLGQASVKSATYTGDYINGTQLNISFRGLTNDGDNDTYSGTATFNFRFVKQVGGSGRGGGYPGYVMYLTGYTMTVTYN